MSQFAILRIQKLKAGVAVRRSLKHAFREQQTPNADPRRLCENSHHGAASVDEAMRRFHDRLPQKVRKNAVLVVEFLVTASPEVMAGKSRAEQDRYFDDALAWLRNKHGAENVVYAGVHRDEITPHLYAYVIPLDSQGKLNCRAFYGGADALRKMQTEFAERVGKRHGLDRGIEGSRARHTTVREFYAGIQRAESRMPTLKAEALKARELEPGSLLKRLVIETPEQVAERITHGIHDQFRPLAAAAGGVAMERKKRRQAETTAKAKAAELESARPLIEATRGLSPAEIDLVVGHVQALKRAKEVAAEAARRAAELVRYAREATSSALVRWARWAFQAMDQAGGDHLRVQWVEAEANWTDAARNGRDGAALSSETISRTLSDHSPGRAGVEREILLGAGDEKRIERMSNEMEPDVETTPAYRP